jgi:hypothetical protein
VLKGDWERFPGQECVLGTERFLGTECVLGTERFLGQEWSVSWEWRGSWDRSVYWEWRGSWERRGSWNRSVSWERREGVKMKIASSRRSEEEGRVGGIVHSSPVWGKGKGSNEENSVQVMYADREPPPFIYAARISLTKISKVTRDVIGSRDSPSPKEKLR